MKKLFGQTLFFLILLSFFGALDAASMEKNMMSYSYKEGDAPPQKTFPEELTFLQWNICFLPDKNPVAYGGVDEAMKRVDKIAGFILDADADIVALQEAHDKKAIDALIEKLRSGYGHFYYDIGPTNIYDAIDAFIVYVLERIGYVKPFLNSGLLVISKHPLKDISFKRYHYPNQQWEINKGFFAFTIHQDNSPLARVFLTHLQPYDTPKDRKVREMELLEIVDTIHNSEETAGSTLPAIVLGDMNIPWGSPEYRASSIHKYFDERYAQDIAAATPENCTATDFFTDYRKGTLKKEYLKSFEKGEAIEPYNPYAAIIDYFLVYKRPHPYSFHTVALETFPTDFETCGDAALEALSDHKALHTTLSLPY